MEKKTQRTISLLRITGLLVLLGGIVSEAYGILLLTEPRLLGVAASICNGPYFFLVAVGALALGVVGLIIGAAMIFLARKRSNI